MNKEESNNNKRKTELHSHGVQGTSILRMNWMYFKILVMFNTEKCNSVLCYDQGWQGVSIAPDPEGKRVFEKMSNVV
jgi:hypothetical protein